MTELVVVLLIPLTIAVMAITFVVTVGAVAQTPRAVDTPAPATIPSVEGVEA